MEERLSNQCVSIFELWLLFGVPPAKDYIMLGYITPELLLCGAGSAVRLDIMQSSWFLKGPFQKDSNAIP